MQHIIKVLVLLSLTLGEFIPTFLPGVFNSSTSTPQNPAPQNPTSNLPVLYVPYFQDSVPVAQAAISWFGRVNLVENYADVRVAYTQDHLQVHLQVFDHDLWYEINPNPETFTNWDAASLYLEPGGQGGAGPARYRFDGQLVSGGATDSFRAAYAGSTGSGGLTWTPADLSFTTGISWRGNAPNDAEADRGWRIIFQIPYSSIGLSGTPQDGDMWSMGIQLHDRDHLNGSPSPKQFWPAGGNPSQPASWGKLAFGGIPALATPNLSPSGATTIRHRLEGAQAVDGMVGGSTTCGRGVSNWWTEWGERSFPGAEQVNVQNQTDVSDWPCFSKFYLKLPLDSIPPGKVVLSAQLTLYQFGNAGGGQWGPAPDSLLQVSTVSPHWEESSLSWNSAPTPLENVAQTWARPITDWPGWPGVAVTWDVSRAVAEAYREGELFSVVFYSADANYHSGKYFISSDTGDWNAEGRPTLEVTWGNPAQ
jgi:hypothetical protein